MNSEKLKYRVLFSHTDNIGVTQTSLSVYKYNEIKTRLHILVLPQNITYFETSALCASVQNALNRGIDVGIVVDYCLL